MGISFYFGPDGENMLVFTFPVSPAEGANSARTKNMVMKMVYSCETVPNYTFCQSETPYADPVQGKKVLEDSSCNCEFIAALSSIAWVTGGVPEAQVLANGSFRITFYDDETHLPVGTNVTPNLWYNPEKNLLLNARSLSVTDIWPGIYEKAYIKKYYPEENACKSHQIEWPGNPKPALIRLTGLGENPGDKDPVSFDAIKSLVIGGQISRPMVLWTKTDIEDGTDEMVHNHSYSVFGIFTDAANKEYLVLRNPQGKNNNTDNPNVIDNAIWQVNQRSWECTIPPPASGCIKSIQGDRTIQLGQNGFFALKPEKLTDYFAGWAYVGV